MSKLLKGVVPRVLWIAISILLQIVLWVGLIYFLGDYSEWILAILLGLSFLCVIYILIQDTYSEVKITWIILMLLFPVFGLFCYLYLNGQLSSKKVKKLHGKMEFLLENEMLSFDSKEVEEILQESSIKRQQDYLEFTAHSPAQVHTELQYYKLGDEMLEPLLEELRKAEKFIFLEFFIIDEGEAWNKIERILSEKAMQGVDIRILYDYFGALFTVPIHFAKKLNEKQIRCHAFNPYTHAFNASYNNRDHRKIVVIDGNVGFTGGINLADEYFNMYPKHGHWKDTAVMLRGDAVYNLTIMFLTMWEAVTNVEQEFSKYQPTMKYKTDGIVQPFYDNPFDENAVGESLYMSMLNQANDYVYITTPYLIISREMITSLINAAKSKIDVRLILPGIADKKIVHFMSRSYYAELVRAGVKIYEYTPGFVHAKMFICDDKSAVIGTINLDYRSLMHHYECGVWLYQNSIIEEMKQDFIETQSQCIEITRESIDEQRRGIFGFVRFVALGVLRAFAPLM